MCEVMIQTSKTQKIILNNNGSYLGIEKDVLL